MSPGMGRGELRRAISGPGRRRRMVTALCAACALSACGGGPSSAAPGDGCVEIPASGVRVLGVAGPGGEQLDAVVLGSGPTGVVLSDQSDRNLCSWLPFARTLVRRNYRVFLHDTRAGAPEEEVAAVATAARQDGVRRLLLMGASEGAKASLIAASRVAPPVDGVVTLSAESRLNGQEVLPAVRRQSVPLLLVTADRDWWGSDSASRAFYAAAPNRDKKLVMVSGWDHGVDLLNNTKDVADPVLAFLDAHSR